MRTVQEDAGGEKKEEGAAEGTTGGDGDEDEDEELSWLVCILPDRSCVTESNLHRLAFAKDMRQLWPSCERNTPLETAWIA